ncbi:hypothetical protein C8Q75DRAFT_738536 [Abortiporus biennis]|nr:hypothetical protein C8Q75DRAFT_738536 [Abortiporus biennis]
MASQVASQNQASSNTQNSRGQSRGGGGRRGGHRGRGGGRGRGGNPKGAPNHQQQSREQKEKEVAEEPTVEATPKAGKDVQEGGSDTEEDICFICAEPVKYYSVSQCNHRTCHVCALRLRALYKKTDCTFCKEPQPSVIFTTSPDAPWSSYSPESIPYKDAKLSIFFETQEMMEDSLILLRFNCPDSSCDYIANGWSDLKLHTRATHGKLMCDICIRFKKIFAHEHVLYSPSQLPLHLPSLQRGHKPGHPKEQPEGGVHPLCEFCRECYFSEDELYTHMRERHEECFVCKRNEIKNLYFRNYDQLEQHFNQAHFPCTQPACLARKFVVFGSALDLKGHMVEEHGADMSSRDRKDARRVQADFEFEEVGIGGRRGGRRDRGDREREREPPPQQQAGPSSSSRPGAAGARRREAFGGNLTTTEGNANGTIPTPHISRNPSRRQTPSPPSADVDPAVLERHSTFLARVSSLAPNPNGAVPAVKAAVRSYRASESAARDLISTIWNVLDHNLEGTASLVNALVDLLDEEDKKKDLLESWNGFKIEQRNQFPELVPSGMGTEWAGITGGRVLNAKQATSSRSSLQSSRQVLDRVAAAASSSSAPAFPPLRPSITASSSPGGYRQSQRNTPWASSSAAAGATATSSAPIMRGPTSVPGPGARTKTKAAPVLSRTAFPELPTSGSVRVPRAAVSGNQSLRNILGESAPPSPAWKSNKSNGSGSATPVDGGGDSEAAPAAAAEPTQGKGKKGKGKQKQTLFTLGSFPT